MTTTRPEVLTTTPTTPTAPTARSGRPSGGFGPIPFARLVAVELTKMFDTRSGLWLLRSIAITALLASVAVIIWAPDDVLTYDTFASAIGFPMAVILPIIAILSVTSEWSQRTGLTTFTFVPRRGRVISAKLTATLLVGVSGILIAATIGAVGNTVGSTIAGVDITWDLGLTQLTMIVIATVLNMMIGFMLAVVLRNSAAAIVAYFVYGFVLTGLTELLAGTQQWFFDIRGWVDFNYSQGVLFESVPNSEQWAQLATSGSVWLLLPLIVGLRLVLRSEVK